MLFSHHPLKQMFYTAVYILIVNAKYTPLRRQLCFVNEDKENRTKKILHVPLHSHCQDVFLAHVSYDTSFFYYKKYFFLSCLL